MSQLGGIPVLRTPILWIRPFFWTAQKIIILIELLTISEEEVYESLFNTILLFNDEFNVFISAMKIISSIRKYHFVVLIIVFQIFSL